METENLTFVFLVRMDSKNLRVVKVGRIVLARAAEVVAVLVDSASVIQAAAHQASRAVHPW